MIDQQLTIGKDESCDIHVGGRYAEPVHATLIIQNNRVTIQDHNTRFGTHVSGRRIHELTTLHAKDIVKIGAQLLDWQSYTEGLEAAAYDPNPIYFKDLFSYKGEISKSNYRFILLSTLVAPLLIFIGVPALIMFITELTMAELSLFWFFLIEKLWWLFGLLTTYVFVMQSIKRYGTWQNE